MNKLLSRLKRTRFVYRRSSNFTKTVVMSAIVLSVAALIALSISIHAANAKIEKLEEEAIQLEQDGQRWEDKIAALGTAESIWDIAREIFGYVFPDTVIVKPES